MTTAAALAASMAAPRKGDKGNGEGIGAISMFNRE
jgi:hypothetical protein